MRRFLSCALLVCVISYVCLISAFAYRLAPYFVCAPDADQVPAGSLYLDLLVRAQDLPPEWYTEEAGNLEHYNIRADAPIAEYDEDGYVSYVLHCKDAAACNTICKEDDGAIAQITFGEDENLQFTEEMMSVFKKFRWIRFAYVDAEGNILSVTEAARPNPIVPFCGRDLIEIHGETVQVEFSSGPPYWLIPAAFFCIVGIVVYWTVHTRQMRRKEA